MAKSNVYIKSGLWNETDKPTKGSLSLDSVINKVAGTAGIPQFDIQIIGGVLDPSSTCSCIIKSEIPVNGNSFKLVNFWSFQINTDGQSVIIPTESYFNDMVITDDGSSNLESISIPNAINLNAIYFSSSNLTSVNIGEIGILKRVTAVEIAGCALSEETINYILALLVSLDGTNGTILFNGDVLLDGGTSAAPTGQGLIDKATIESRGGTVTTN
jgi:hypothetical protein